MKKTTIAIALCGFVLGTIVSAEETDRPKRGPGERGQIFKSLDTDDDHAISQEEAGEKWQYLGRLDTDKDGKVTVAELAAGRPGAGPDGPKGPKGNPRELFERADENKDEKITENEVPQEVWERLSKLDTDKDGAVDKKELEAGRMAMGGKGGPDGKGKGGEFFDRADKDKNGKISKDEVPEQAWDRLSKWDKNKDEAVSKEEMAMGYREGMKGKGKGEGDRPGGGAAAIFSSLDKNNDEKLSEEEVSAEMWAKISKADEDADGNVSKAELEKVYQARQEMMGEDTKGKGKGKKRPELEKESA